MTATEILVVILSSFLTLLVVLGIILGILLLRVSHQIRRVSTSAEQGIERTISSVNRLVIPTAIAKAVTEQISKRRKGKK